MYLLNLVDTQRMSRNFFESPITSREAISYNDLHYLFMELNLTKNEVATVLGTNSTKVFKYLKIYNIVKDKYKISKSQAQMLLHTKGVTNVMKLKEVAEKCSKSMLKTMELNGEEIKQKRIDTIRSKYNVDNPSQSEMIKQKKRETCFRNYGYDNPNKCPEIRKRTEQTVRSRYNGFTLEKESKNRIKYDNTIETKYGVDNPMKCDKISRKTSQTLKSKTKEISEKCLLKYGVAWTSQLQSVKEKINRTKRKNNSFHISKPEERVYYKLSQKFIVNRQYTSINYPFACDFYIPELDLYIECHFTWTHGAKPFDSTDEECIDILNKWKVKSNSSTYYKNAIKVWTDLDVRKKQVSEQNNLNIIFFYTEKEFNEWYNSL